MVVDTNFLATEADLKRAAVPKHKDHITLHLHTFPISKHGPTAPLAFETVESLRSQASFMDNVTPQVKQ